MESGITAYGESLGPSIRMSHLWMSESETSEILVPSGGFCCRSPYSYKLISHPSM